MTSSTLPAWLAADMPRGERLLWAGQPAQGVRFTPRLLILNLIGALVLLVSLTWNTLVMSLVGLFDGSLESGALKVVYWIAYVGCILTGLYLVVGTHLTDAQVRRRTFYAVTDRAAYVQIPFGLHRGLSRHPIGRDAPVGTHGGRHRFVWFAERTEGERTRRIGFRDLVDGRSVHDLLTRVKEGRA